MADAKRDGNNIPTLLAVSSSDGVTPTLVYADPVTHRLLVNIITTGANGTFTTNDGKTATVVNGLITTLV